MAISKYVEVKNGQLNKRYSGRKVEAGHLVEDYLSGDVDIKGDFMDFINNIKDVCDFSFVGHHFKFFVTEFLPEIMSHSQKMDEATIKSHYDDQNDIFRWFLGPRMVYTSGYYKTGEETLEEAQDNKLDLIAQKMQLKEGDSLLDIGCGWGTLVAHMAKNYNMDTTGVTITPEQAEWGTKLIKENGMEDQSRILTIDYRDIPQRKYDKISCLEMAEHVGVKYFQKFMEQIYDLLEDDGIFYLQIAALRERKSLLRGPDQETIVWGLFMNEYIFPGADASMPVSWDLRKIEKAGFEINTVENVGIHYSKTIAAWYDNWMSNEDKVVEKYGKMQFRMYQVFLGWSARIAAIGGSSAYQIICHKNINSVDRKRYIGKIALGENKKFDNTTSVSSEATSDKIMNEYETKSKKIMVK
ncbi:MAG: cyclopropane fatty-acyl-phospholipid synthase-like methyltransferase [Aureispira sp.]|jgi:cyclopropane fatty-acyl-phospholipid synthase-like methyltransferase